MIPEQTAKILTDHTSVYVITAMTVMVSIALILTNVFLKLMYVLNMPPAKIQTDLTTASASLDT